MSISNNTTLLNNLLEKANSLPDADVGVDKDALYLSKEEVTSNIADIFQYGGLSSDSCAYGDGKFVAISYDSNNDTDTQRVGYSVDGITWVAGTYPAADFACQAIVYGDGKFVVVGRDSKVGYSTDGINWVLSTIPNTTTDFDAVAYGNGVFVAGGWGDMAYSTNGIEWTVTTHPEGNQSRRSIVYGNGKFVAVNPSEASYSIDGIVWTDVAFPSHLGTSLFTNNTSVVYGDNKFVAVGVERAAYSTDGITWTMTDIPKFTWTNEDTGETVDINPLWTLLTYANGKFVALGPMGYAFYSTDGITWIETTWADSVSRGAGLPMFLKYFNGIFVAIDGMILDTENPIQELAIYSTDGINWSSTLTINKLTDAYGNDVTEEYRQYFTAPSSSAKAICFTINDTHYPAEEGMTWGEWVGSEYNNGGYLVNGMGCILDINSWSVKYTDNQTQFQHMVDITDIIIANTKYICSEGMGRV